MLDVDSGQWCSLGQFTSYNEMVGWVGSSSRFVQNVINNPKNEPRYINQGCAAAGGGILNFWWNPTFQDKFYLEFIQLTIFTWYTEIFAESAFKQVVSMLEMGAKGTFSRYQKLWTICMCM